MTLNVGIIIGSTRPGRNGEAVASWVHELASLRNDAVYHLVDIASFNLPVLDEPFPPSLHQPFTKEHSKAWSAAIAPLDAFIFVTPEYNHSTSGALKNAIDFLFYEWHDKAAGFVSYGSTGGVRAVEHLRGIVGELHIADVRSQVALSLFDDFENFSTFKPRDVQATALNTLFDELVGWGGALKSYREGKQAKAG